MSKNMESPKKGNAIDALSSDDNTMLKSVLSDIQSNKGTTGYDNYDLVLENNNILDMISDGAHILGNKTMMGSSDECHHALQGSNIKAERTAPGQESVPLPSPSGVNGRQVGAVNTGKSEVRNNRDFSPSPENNSHPTPTKRDLKKIQDDSGPKCPQQERWREPETKLESKLFNQDSKDETINNNGESPIKPSNQLNQNYDEGIRMVTMDQEQEQESAENKKGIQSDADSLKKQDILNDIGKAYEKIKEDIKRDEGDFVVSPSGSNGGGQVVVKDQVKAVVGDLENVLGELKTVVGDLKVLVDQIDAVTNKIDEEYGAEGQNNENETKRYKKEDQLVDRRRRSASVLETGTPKRELPNKVRHSLSQPFDVLRTNKDWVINAPADLAQKASDSPRHSHHSGGSMARRKDDPSPAHQCQVHRAKLDEVMASPKKDDIIICTPGSICHKMEALVGNTTPSRRKLSLSDVCRSPSKTSWPNSPKITTPSHLSRTPTRSAKKLSRSSSQPGKSSKSNSNKSESPCTPRNSRGKLTSPQTSNSSGIGNSNESGNGNTYMYPNAKNPYISDKISISDNLNKTAKIVTQLISDCSATESLNEPKVCGKGKDSLNFQFAPCSPSPDSDYCGVYEKELELKLELVFEDEVDNDDDRRTLNLQPYPGYGPTYDQERVSRWAAYTVVNIGSYPLTDDQGTDGRSETSSDILNDNSIMSLTPASEDKVFLGSSSRGPCLPWPLPFGPSCDQVVRSHDTG